jgi:hypothetical protein
MIHSRRRFVNSSTTKGVLALAIEALLLLLPCGTFAQDGTIRVCVSQEKSSTDDPGDPPAIAIRLAKQLSGQRTADGLTVQPALITETGRKAVRARTEEEGCAYLIRTWQHLHPNIGDNDPSTPGFSPLQDQDTLVFELRNPKTNKLIYSTQTRPLTIYRKGNRIYDPYPTVAKQIVAKFPRSPSQ